MLHYDVMPNSSHSIHGQNFLSVATLCGETKSEIGIDRVQISIALDVHHQMLDNCDQSRSTTSPHLTVLYCNAYDLVHSVR